jgi:hypothetical protein
MPSPSPSQFIVIEQRFCGPPKSANGGYACGLLADHIDGDAEITLLAPPPLGQRLEIVAGEHGVDLRTRDTTLATGRRIRVEVSKIPIVTFGEAEDAVHLSPYDASRHPLPTCFVCGPLRDHGDGLRIIPCPLTLGADDIAGIFVAPWVPSCDLSTRDGAVDRQFIWAALDCPTGFAGAGARHLGMTGAEPILLGRMSAHIERRPCPGDRCVIVAWPTGRVGRKLFANSALLGATGELLAVAQATWLVVDRQVQLGF